ncbi:hypothetical protein BGZ96_008578 [Linnemannia gamsii]|uniref:Uracil-DNA glycosylase-like domain-containing protein n=1 Tax=Linnemannia gamsii TaxID=64522 RepID=A0ABQ7JY12_9FUNG|nr:hypothetical protein BGZ96_008578 [Linnemannia gamsii]
MTQFTDMLSKFAHDKSRTINGERSSTSISNGAGTSEASTRNSKKRTIKTEDDVEGTEGAAESSSATTTELSTQVRKSLRLSSATNADTPPAGPFISRTVSADSVKTRPHHRRTTVTEVAKKEETTVVRRGTQGRNAGYAAPATYAHLEYVGDIIDYDLDVLFVGINPGVKTSERGHHYAGPNNHFWPCLSDSGLLPPGVRLGPNDDKSLPALTNMGLTNLVDRPSRMGNELSDAECRAAAPILTAKIKKYRPRFVCFVGKQAWDMYSGVGLGLQTAWVSWDDTPEDDELLLGADIANPIQRQMNEQGYRLAPFLGTGPGAEKLDGQLMAEGAPSPYVKREDGGLVGINAELKEEEEVDCKKDVKMEDVDQDVKPVKAELDDKTLIKKELNDDDDEHNKLYVKKEQDDKNAIKTELYHASTSSSSSRAPATPRYRGGVLGSRMFVMPSTSGRVTQYRKEDKLAFFQQLAELVRRDRQIRGVKAPWEQ